jgi:hypothetical protein
MNTDPLKMLTKAFENLGAPPDQAGTMAVQLLKRAGQLSEKEGISEEAALARLLEKVIAGRRGEYGAAEPEH